MSKNIQQKSSQIFLLIICVLTIGRSQILRDIVLDYLSADTNEDYILSPQEIHQHYRQVDKINTENTYHNLETFRKQIYPKYFWIPYDIDFDHKLSLQQLRKLIGEKWTIYTNSNKNNHKNANELSLLSADNYLQSCDQDGDQHLNSSEILLCLHGVLTLQRKNIANPIESSFFRNKNQGYDLHQFKKMMPRFKGSVEQIQNYVNNMFDRFQWDNDKILQDHDQIIGREQGRFLQPIFVMIVLDRNRDGVLLYEEANLFLRRFENPQLTKIIDVDANLEISKDQFISYYVYASCVDCDLQDDEQEKKQKQDYPSSQQKQGENEQL